MGSWVAGGVVLCVVVLSVESLQAATPNSAKAETEARMSFFMIFSPWKTPAICRQNRPIGQAVEGEMPKAQCSCFTSNVRT